MHYPLFPHARFVLLLALSACAYEARVLEGRQLNAISGTVVYAGVGKPATTYMTLFAADNPGPPAGTGSPVTFTAVPKRGYTGNEAGLQSAPYALTRIEQGDYLLNALVDQDGDFNPFITPLAGATCGDWGGAHLTNLATQTIAPISVGGGKLIDDVTVLVGQLFSLERPAFTFSGPAQWSLGALLAGQADPRFRLRTTTIGAAFSETLILQLGPECAPDPDCLPELPTCPCAPDTLVDCGTALWVQLRDQDLDGVVDPYPGPQGEAGILDIWPRIYLEYIGDLGTFTHQGQTLPERWVGESYPLAAEILATAFADPTNPVAPGVVAGFFGPVGVPFPVQELSATFVPAFRHYHADGVAGVDANGPFDIEDLTTGLVSPDVIPAGAWSTTVVSFTGQTWTVPNELGVLEVVVVDPAFDPVGQTSIVGLQP